jgi:hypothetical protein
MDRSSQLLHSVGTTIHSVCLKQPQHRTGRNITNTTRLLYLASLVTGLFRIIGMVLIKTCTFLIGRVIHFFFLRPLKKIMRIIMISIICLFYLSALVLIGLL